MDCFGTYLTHVQTCDNVRVQSATEWTASVHTLTHVQTLTQVRPEYLVNDDDDDDDDDDDADLID